MKKLILGCLCIGAFASCNVKDSSEYKQVQAQRDSLAQVNAATKNDLNDLTGIISDVQDNFDKIKASEKYLNVQSKSKGELSKDTKAKINENFQMMNDILQKNKATIATLNSRLKNSKGEVSGLKKIIDKLNASLAEKTAEITQLQADLASRDKQIAELTDNVKSLNENVEQLSDKTVMQASKIDAQDKALYTAYYMFGTSGELNKAGVASESLLTSAKVLREQLDQNKSKFIKIDTRETKEIKLYSKKATVLSEHPKGSYTLKKDGNGEMAVYISDSKSFWSLTKFLVVEVK